MSLTWAEVEARFPECSPAWDRDVNNGKTAWDERWSPGLEVRYGTLWATSPLYGFRVTRFAFDGESWIDNAEGERRAMLRERIRREGGWPDTLPDMLRHLAGCRSLHDWHARHLIFVSSCPECNGVSRLVVSRSDKERCAILADDIAHGRVFLRDQGPMFDEMRAAAREMRGERYTSVHVDEAQDLALCRCGAAIVAGQCLNMGCFVGLPR